MLKFYLLCFGGRNIRLQWLKNQEKQILGPLYEFTKFVYQYVIGKNLRIPCINSKGRLFCTGGGYNTGIYRYYNTNHSWKFCAGKTSITPITLNLSYFCKRSFFAGITTIKPIKNEAGMTAITTITTGFPEITPFTTKSDWCYNHTL